MLGRKVSRTELLKEMRGKSPAEERHQREECGCFATYPERADLFKKGILWLEKTRGEEKTLEVAAHDELNRRWCGDDLETFRDWWRGVLRAA